MLSVESSIIEIIKKENIHEYWNDTEFITAVTVTIFILFALEILFLIPILNIKFDDTNRINQSRFLHWGW